MKTEEIIETLTEEKAPEDEVYLSTGCTLLDLVVGGGVGMGMPAGYILNIAGNKSSGKTQLTHELIAKGFHRHKKNFKWFYDDTERGSTFNSMDLFGVDIRPEDRKIGTKKVEDSETVEEMDAKVGMFCDTMQDGEIGVYVIDSLDGLSTADKEEAADKRMGQLKSGKDVKDDGSYDTSMTKFLSQQFFKTRKDDLNKKNVLLVVLSQIRDKFNAMAFSEKYDITGGRALEFYAHTRLFLTCVRNITRGDRIVGVVVEAKTKKSKTPRPFRSCRYIVYFDYGIDEIGSNLCYLFDLLDEKGHFKPCANMIPWNQKKEPSKENITAWLTESGRIGDCKAAKKAKDGKANLSMEFMEEWIAETCKEAYEEEFGLTYTLDELIKAADENPALRKEIRKKTILKWEAEEEAARTKRPRKYSTEE